MGYFRARPLEVEAFQIEDGRYLIAAEPPRLLDAAEFEAAFEAIPDKRKRSRRGAARLGTGRRRQDRTAANIVEEHTHGH